MRAKRRRAGILKEECMRLFAVVLMAMGLAILLVATGPSHAADTDEAEATHGLFIGVSTVQTNRLSIRATHSRTVQYAETWLRERRYLRTPTIVAARTYPGWVPYRATPYRGGYLQYLGSGLYTIVPRARYDFSCRYLANCPCRFLSGC